MRTVGLTFPVTPKEPKAPKNTNAPKEPKAPKDNNSKD